MEYLVIMKLFGCNSFGDLKWKTTESYLWENITLKENLSKYYVQYWKEFPISKILLFSV